MAAEQRDETDRRAGTRSVLLHLCEPQAFVWLERVGGDGGGAAKAS